MGGYGALKLAFRHPSRYLAAVAVAPAVFPGITTADVPPRNRMSVLGELLEAIDRSPGDAIGRRLGQNVEAIRAVGPALFLGVGDHDEFHLQDGAEHLHRVLWELGVSHEYLVRRNGTHMGAGSEALQRAAHAFLADALRAPPTAPG
jgi:S-formylglutathione hydrolase